MTILRSLFALPLLLLTHVVIAQSNSSPLNIETVLVDAPNNEPDITNLSVVHTPLGGVDYCFEIGKYDVTAAQWCSFLNAVATQGPVPDPYELFDIRMQEDPAVKCIKRSLVLNAQGTREYHYDLINEAGDAARGINRSEFPITYVNYYAAVRFCNWLSNGQPNTGQENSFTTEEGPYTISNNNNGSYTVTANFSANNECAKYPHGFYRLPTEDEWYKAAYYQKPSPTTTACYWLYSTAMAEMPFNSIQEKDNQEEAPFQNANYQLTYNDKINKKVVNQYATVTPPYLTAVGFFKNSPGPFGTYDMSGNVEQWTDPQRKLVNGNNANITRGGSWRSTTPDDISSQRHSLTFSQSASSNIGFRVVKPHVRTWSEYWQSWRNYF